MVDQEVQDRIELLYGGQILSQNCIGAALTVFGITDFEHYVDPFEAYKYLYHLTEISELVSGSLLVFEDVDASDHLKHPIVTHMAVVIEDGPLKIMHREYSMFTKINRGKPEYYMNAPFTETTLGVLKNEYAGYTRMKIFC